jgi:hypothetical protein
MISKSCKYQCNICNKNYSSSNSLWNHNKKFHNMVTTFTTITPQTTTHVSQNTTQNKNQCTYCKKILSRHDSLMRHQKICDSKIDQENKITQLENKNKEFENKIMELESKINNKTNSKINNKINTQTNNNNNGTINNITINQFGKENINAISVKEIKDLIKNDNYLVDIVKLLNFNEKYPENHNFCNTSLEGKYISVFNSDTNKIEKINKNDFYDKVLCNSFSKMDNLSLILELNNDVKEQIKEKYREHLDNKLTHIKEIFYKDKIYKKNYKTNINELAYNKNKIILDTWTAIPEIENHDSDSECSAKYSAFTESSDSD